MRNTGLGVDGASTGRCEKYAGGKGQFAGNSKGAVVEERGMSAGGCRDLTVGESGVTPPTVERTGPKPFLSGTIEGALASLEGNVEAVKEAGSGCNDVA